MVQDIIIATDVALPVEGEDSLSLGVSCPFRGGQACLDHGCETLIA
jgi:hypothetical protein